jgi:hypothetical protein
MFDIAVMFDMLVNIDSLDKNDVHFVHDGVSNAVPRYRDALSAIRFVWRNM